jgi:DNA-binding NtrC family response regulator
MIMTSAVCREKEEETIAVLREITDYNPATQVILVVEPQDVDIALSSLHEGAFQYTKLPLSDEELKQLIEVALANRPMVMSETELDQNSEQFEQIVGNSPAIRKVYEQIEQAAAVDVHILLLGETGTGKDLVAQAIHRRSDRENGPYIPVNLGALPTELVASELFGHEKGSFTGAAKQHKGKFEQGENGVVFLDEIDAIDEKVQVSLLRLIEQRKFHRLGGRRSVMSNARLIAASNSDLEDLVQAGSFRQDLFYRLDVFRITVPPLRDRREDIRLLVQAFLARYNKQFKKRVLSISPEALESLEGYDWPGNVRELKNIIQRAIVICEGEEILLRHLPPRFGSVEIPESKLEFAIGTSLDEVERQMVLRALHEAENNRTRAAELLGISRRAIYNKLKKHNIE